MDMIPSSGYLTSENLLSPAIPRQLRPWVFERCNKLISSARYDQNPAIAEVRVKRFFLGNHTDSLMKKFEELGLREGHFKAYFWVIAGSVIEDLSIIDSPMVNTIQKEIVEIHRVIKKLSEFSTTLNVPKSKLKEGARKYFSSREGRAKIYVAEAVFGVLPDETQFLMSFMADIEIINHRIESFRDSDLPYLKKQARKGPRKTRSQTAGRTRLIEAIANWPPSKKVPAKLWADLVTNVFPEMGILSDEDFRSHVIAIKKRRTSRG